jgi:hypothetical protein
MSEENASCYNYIGGAIPGGLKPQMLFNLLRCTESFIINVTCGEVEKHYHCSELLLSVNCVT